MNIIIIIIVIIYLLITKKERTIEQLAQAGRQDGHDNRP